MASDGGPQTVTTLLGAAGACPEITVNGKTWRIGHPTKNAKTTLEQLAVDAAYAEIEANEGRWPAKRLNRALKELDDEVKARQYRTWGEGWQRIVWGPMSAHLFLLSLLRENHPEATEDDALALAAADPGRVKLAIMQVVPNFVALLLAERPGTTEEQKRAIMQAVDGILAHWANQTEEEAENSQPPPKPTPETTAKSSRTGASRSVRSRGASTPTKLPA